MINLLVISNDPKAEYIKGALQPLLKVIIDVVPDFDNGLKAVFEKRPSIVCIQEQIGEISGESVTRHIRMLLDKKAPKFILLHSGNGSEKKVTGVYEYLVDLNQSDASLSADIQRSIKSLLGEQWEMIYIPTVIKTVSSALLPIIPAEMREDADRLVDDFLADLESPVIPAVAPISSFPSSPDEETAPNVEAVPDTDESGILPVPVPRPRAAVPPAAAEFHISQDAVRIEEQIPEDLLLAFEENFRPKSRLSGQGATFLAIISAVVAIGWYLFTQPAGSAIRLPKAPSAKQPSASMPAAGAVPVTPAVSVPHPLSAAPLPPFIPKNGHDASYAAKNPGWERYVGKLHEFRLFNVSGRIQALQVLSIKGVPVPESFMRSVLVAFAGSGEYRIISHELKAGIRVENGRIHDTGDIAIYRKDGAVTAFVVSID